MSYYLCRFVLAPEITKAQVIRLAEVLRERSQKRCKLILRTLENKKPRSEHAKAAKAAQVKIIDVEGGPSDELLLEAAGEVFGNQNYLYCRKNDRVSENDYCYPKPI